MWLVGAAVLGVLFGAGDQALGSLVHGGDWHWQVAEVSAPWLLLPLVVGSAQRSSSRAAIAAGVFATAAVFAYIAMILSPMEGVHLHHPVAQIMATVSSQSPWLVGAAVIAPLYGVLGNWWTRRRHVASAIVVTATLCLEPVARLATGQLQPLRVIWQVEVLLGVAVGLSLWILLRRTGQPPRTVPGAVS